MPQLFPAPWSLRGEGHIFLFRFSQAFLQQDGLIPPSLRSSFVGGVGALMLVDYAHSDCGPYRELLLIPGNFRIGDKVRPSITRIWVSTEVSVVNGRKNWGIPKYQANFDVAQRPDGSESWHVADQTGAVFRGSVKVVGYTPPLPIHSALIPHTLMQSWQSQLFVTKVSASGWGRPCKLSIDQAAAPRGLDFRTERPLMGLGMRVDPFSMTFHTAAVYPLASA